MSNIPLSIRIAVGVLALLAIYGLGWLDGVMPW